VCSVSFESVWMDAVRSRRASDSSYHCGYSSGGLISACLFYDVIIKLGKACT
jgi:hypothetical protein